MNTDTVMILLNCLPLLLAFALMGIAVIRSVQTKRVPVKVVSINQAKRRRGKRK